jgi:hypothetical protein
LIQAFPPALCFPPQGLILVKGKLVASGDAGSALAVWPDREPFSNFSYGRFAHFYTIFEPLTPVPVNHRQGLFYPFKITSQEEVPL